MTERAKRISRKELRQPDEFISTSRRVAEWGRDNPTYVTWGAAGLLAVLLIAGGASWWMESRARRANQQFYGAIELYRAEQWNEAYDGFSTLADDLGGTDYGKLARIYAARSAAKVDKPAEAISFYEGFLANGPHTAALEQLARFEMAAVLRKTGDVDRARAELDKAHALEGPIRPEVTFALAKVADESGEKDRALELYGRYVEEAQQGPDRELARSRIVALGGTPPAPEMPQGFPPGMNPLQVQVE
jgi:hypothetical protein